MSRQAPASPVNPLLIVLLAVLASAALPYLGALTTALILCSGLVIYGLYLLRGGQRVSGGLMLAAALAILLAVLLRG